MSGDACSTDFVLTECRMSCDLSQWLDCICGSRLGPHSLHLSEDFAEGRHLSNNVEYTNLQLQLAFALFPLSWNLPNKSSGL